VTLYIVRHGRTAANAGGLLLGRVEVDERWIELDYGDWDQMPIADVPRDDWARWRADLDFRPPAGETLRELGVRVRAACDDLAADAVDGDVVVLTHVSPYKAALAWALGVGDEISWRLHVVPASVSRIGVRPTGPVLLTFNEQAHLPT
jgi:broad specificity phosphatase PhoE